jgi:hypothetical protein
MVHHAHSLPSCPQSRIMPTAAHHAHITMASPRNQHGISLKSPWHRHDIAMATPRHQHGISLKSPWHRHDIAMATPRHHYDIVMTSPHHHHAIATASTWRLHDITVTSPRHQHGGSMTSPWHPHNTNRAAPRHHHDIFRPYIDAMSETWSFHQWHAGYMIFVSMSCRIHDHYIDVMSDTCLWHRRHFRYTKVCTLQRCNDVYMILDRYHIGYMIVTSISCRVYYCYIDDMTGVLEVWP